MSFETVFTCITIMLGALIMLFSIIKAKEIPNIMQHVPVRSQKKLKFYLATHRVLMLFFLLGYIIVMIAIFFNVSLVSNSFVGVIFFLGAIFVLMGIFVQTWLLSEIQSTLSGLLPICAKCKKIQNNASNPDDPQSWQNIESYISKKSNVNFTHGLCPQCFKCEMKELEGLKKE